MATDNQCKDLQIRLTEIICNSCELRSMCSRKTVFRFDGICCKIGIKLKVEPWDLGVKMEWDE